MKLLSYFCYFFYLLKKSPSNADACWLINTFPFSGSKRRKIISQANPEVSDGTAITPPIRIEDGHHLVTGKRVFINADCLFSGAGTVTIGSQSLIGPRVTFCTTNHHANRTHQSAYASTTLDIKIEEEVWVGAGVVICPGVTTGRNSIIAAGSVVTRDIPPSVLAAGIPCAVKRHL